jgi:hypothetical protein
MTAEWQLVDLTSGTLDHAVTGRTFSSTSTRSAARLLPALPGLDDELITLYVADRTNERLLDRTRWFAPNDVTDPAFLEAIEAQEKLAEDRRKPLDVLAEMTKKGSWTQKDIRLLWQVSVDEYVAMLKAFKGEQLAEIVRMALSLGQGAREQEIARNVRGALTRIGRENALNKCRMRKFGIRV